MPAHRPNLARRDCPPSNVGDSDFFDDGCGAAAPSTRPSSTRSFRLRAAAGGVDRRARAAAGTFWSTVSAETQRQRRGDVVRRTQAMYPLSSAKVAARTAGRGRASGAQLASVSGTTEATPRCAARCGEKVVVLAERRVNGEDVPHKLLFARRQFEPYDTFSIQRYRCEPSQGGVYRFEMVR